MALSKSDRVHISDQVAKRLANEEWSLIDLTLSQFGLPTRNTWAGEKYTYVIEMMKDAAEDDLVGIAHPPSSSSRSRWRLDFAAGTTSRYLPMSWR